MKTSPNNLAAAHVCLGSCSIHGMHTWQRWRPLPFLGVSYRQFGKGQPMAELCSLTL